MFTVNEIFKIQKLSLYLKLLACVGFSIKFIHLIWHASSILQLSVSLVALHSTRTPSSSSFFLSFFLSLAVVWWWVGAIVLCVMTRADNETRDRRENELFIVGQSPTINTFTIHSPPLPCHLPAHVHANNSNRGSEQRQQQLLLLLIN